MGEARAQITEQALLLPHHQREHQAGSGGGRQQGSGANGEARSLFLGRG